MTLTIRDIPDLPYQPILLRRCAQGVELVGAWPDWTTFGIDEALDVPVVADGALTFLSVGGEPVRVTDWQGFAWDRRGGFIEIRVHNQRVRYRVIDIVSRHLVCQLEKGGLG